MRSKIKTVEYAQTYVDKALYHLGEEGVKVVAK
jgi:hypothetical protein